MRNILENVEAFDFKMRLGYQLGVVRQTISANLQMAADQPPVLLVALSGGTARNILLPSITNGAPNINGRVHLIGNAGAAGVATVLSHADDGAKTIAVLQPGQAAYLFASFADLTWFGVTDALTTFGGGLGTFLPMGNINVQVPGVTAGINPGATGADNVIFSYSLPASSFDRTGRGITVTGAGNFGATGNNKTVKLIFNPATAVVGSTVGGGGVTIASTGVVTQNTGAWVVMGSLFKRGAAASNTQVAVPGGVILSGTHAGATAAVQEVTATESGAILVAVTGNAATATTDIIGAYFEVTAMD